MGGICQTKDMDKGARHCEPPMFHYKLPKSGAPFKCEEEICENYLCLHCHFVVDYEGEVPNLRARKKKSKTAVRKRYCLECFIRIKR